jgi:hypothetical protein
VVDVMVVPTLVLVAVPVLGMPLVRGGRMGIGRGIRF